MDGELGARLRAVEARLVRPAVRPIDPLQLARRARWRAARSVGLAAGALVFCLWLWPVRAVTPGPAGPSAAEIAELRLRARALVSLARRGDGARLARIREVEAAGVRSLVATLRSDARQEAFEELRRRSEGR